MDAELVGWAEDANDYNEYFNSMCKSSNPYVKWELINYDLHNQVRRWRTKYLNYGEKHLEIELKYLDAMLSGILRLSNIYTKPNYQYVTSPYLKGVYIFKINN